jgi:sarcosine oxidase subunit delta
MLYLFCPNCGRYCDETELVCGGEAHITRKTNKNTDQEFYEYLYARKNHKGIIFERWRHSFGCGKWFNVSRCTINNQVFGSYSIKENSPPKTLLAKIKRLRVDFKGWSK